MRKALAGARNRRSRAEGGRSAADERRTARFYRRGSQAKASCGSPGAARARASMPSPATKTGTPSRQSSGPWRCQARHAGRLELQLQAARRPADAGLEAVAGPTRAQLQAGGHGRGDAARRHRSDLDRPAPAGELVHAGTAEVDRRRRLGVPARRCRGAAPAAARTRGGRDSCAARRRRSASASMPRAGTSRSSRSTRLARGAPARRPPQPGAQRRLLCRAGDRRAPGGDVERAVVGRSPPGRPRPLRPGRRSPPAPSAAAAASDASAVGKGRLERRPDLRAAAGCGRSAASALLSSSMYAQPMPAHIGLDRLARHARARAAPRSRRRAGPAPASPTARRRRRRAAPAAGRSRPGRGDGGRAAPGRRRARSAICAQRPVARLPRPGFDALAGAGRAVERRRRELAPAGRAAPSARRARRQCASQRVGVRRSGHGAHAARRTVDAERLRPRPGSHAAGRSNRGRR